MLPVGDPAGLQEDYPTAQGYTRGAAAATTTNERTLKAVSKGSGKALGAFAKQHDQLGALVGKGPIARWWQAFKRALAKSPHNQSEVPDHELDVAKLAEEFKNYMVSRARCLIVESSAAWSCTHLCVCVCVCVLVVVAQVKDKQNVDSGKSAAGIAYCRRRESIRTADCFVVGQGLESELDDIFEQALRSAARLKQAGARTFPSSLQRPNPDALFDFQRTLMPCLSFIENCTTIDTYTCGHALRAMFYVFVPQMRARSRAARAERTLRRRQLCTAKAQAGGMSTMDARMRASARAGEQAAVVAGEQAVMAQREVISQPSMQRQLSDEGKALLCSIGAAAMAAGEQAVVAAGGHAVFAAATGAMRDGDDDGDGDGDGDGGGFDDDVSGSEDERAMAEDEAEELQTEGRANEYDRHDGFLASDDDMDGGGSEGSSYMEGSSRSDTGSSSGTPSEQDSA